MLRTKIVGRLVAGGIEEAGDAATNRPMIRKARGWLPLCAISFFPIARLYTRRMSAPYITCFTADSTDGVL